VSSATPVVVTVTRPGWVRVVGLGECGTHAIFSAAAGPLAVHETELARRLFADLRAGMLLIADRRFRRVRLVAAGRRHRRGPAVAGQELRGAAGGRAACRRSYLSRIYAARDKRRHLDPITVRVVEYTLAGKPAVYRLITTILDPGQALAPELAAWYAQRWEFETSLDELKTHQGAPRMVLRSHTPDRSSRRSTASS
jgi:DDE family transposase